MKTAFYVLGLAAVALLPLPATAGVLTKAVMVGQTQQFMDGGKVTGCGVTLAAFEESSSNGSSRMMFNGSLMFSNPVTGLMKGRVAVIPESVARTGNITHSSAKPLKTKMFWAKAKGADATTISEGQSLRKSDDAGYFIYLTPIRPLLQLIGAVLEGNPVQIGMNASQMTYETVMFGKVMMTDDHKDALKSCLGDWVKMIEDSSDSPDAVGPTGK